MKKKDATIIELKDVYKIYELGGKEVRALNGSSLHIRRGEFVLIMGPSGSGKSTLMNMVGCLDLPTSGTIHLENYNIAHLPESDLAQIRGKTVGFVFQTFNLIATLTALENVMLPMTFQGVPKIKRIQRARELLIEVGLLDRINHKPSEISGGERQRVAIARALANDPDVILADEPTGNLDTKTGVKIMEMLSSLNKNKGKTIVVVTHDSRLTTYADRVIKIMDGVTNE